MKKLWLLPVLLTIIFVTGCQAPAPDVNPLLSEFDTPFGAPPFDRIDDEHYLPAIKEGIRQHKLEIEELISNPEPPTFENTIVAYDNAGGLLRRVNPVFGGLRGAETNPRLQEIARETTPLLSAHSNEISMNQDLFARIQTVYENRFDKNLDAEQLRVVEMYYRDFERNGAALPEDKREELARLRERMSMVSLELSENMLAETNAFELVLEDENDLAGLPPGVISAAAEAAERAGHEGKWVITLHNPSRLPFLQYSERRDLREKVLTAYGERGNNDNENDNKELFAELMQLRLQMARLLGFDNYAEYFLDIQMAENPDNVYDFLHQVWEPAVARADRERAQMQAIADREGAGYSIEAWDWWYYAEKLRQEMYELDDDEVNPYFTIENVREGNFALANKLFGLTFEPRPNATARCDDGQCRIARCDDGFADRNRLPDDGCETPCDDGQLHCRDFVDDRCDGPEAAHWPACNDTLPLEGRRYAAFLWDTNPAWGEVQTGRLAVQADTPVATLQQRVAGNVLLPGRGRAVASSTWDLQRTTGRALELRARDGSSRFLLRQPIDGTNRLLVGIEDDGANPTGRLLVLVETFVSAQRAIGLPEHRALIANPSGETSPIPGGSTALGWVTPMQLPLFRFGPADLGGAEVPLVVPLIEYRDEVRTAPPDGTLVPLDWRLTADGTLRILRPSGQSFGPTWDKVIEGATTLDGHLAFAVARWTTAACPTGMNRVSDNCVPDPVLYASITRNTPAVASLDGPWALVGIAWRPRGTPGGDVLDQRLLDLELLVQGGAITGPAVVGRAERHEDRDTGHPLLRIDLSGPGVSTFDRERLVLEGHVAPGSRVGLFWDRTPRAGFPRPIHGGLFLLLRQDETPR
ncbi:MAG: hypothetical protein EA398_15215 [Deltaproteobacteria bacterium]|nr:MAG: hypothetical protein EA398_15215 [Deltaproteobacteria bacterium]